MIILLTAVYQCYTCIIRGTYWHEFKRKAWRQHSNQSIFHNSYAMLELVVCIQTYYFVTVFRLTTSSLYSDLLHHHCIQTYYIVTVFRLTTSSLYSDLLHRHCIQTYYIVTVFRLTTSSLYSDLLHRHCILSTKLLIQGLLRNRLIVSFKTFFFRNI
jgi:hypothetical protein